MNLVMQRPWLATQSVSGWFFETRIAGQPFGMTSEPGSRRVDSNGLTDGTQFSVDEVNR